MIQSGGASASFGAGVPLHLPVLHHTFRGACGTETGKGDRVPVVPAGLLLECDAEGSVTRDGSCRIDETTTDHGYAPKNDSLARKSLPYTVGAGFVLEPGLETMWRTAFFALV